jgi:hypothetical protein
MAEQHPSIVVMNEPTIGYHLSPFLSNEPGYRAEDLDVGTFTIRRVIENDPDKFFASKYADVWLPGLRRLLNDRLLAHLQREGGETASTDALLLVKEPNGSQSADVIMRAQPTARLLFLLRDGRDVVDSELASFAVGGWLGRIFPHMHGVGEAERLDFVVNSAYQWLWRTEIVQAAFREHHGPKHMLRYEDLLRDPERHLAELFEWLSVPLDRTEVAAVADRHTFDRLSRRGPDRQNRFARPGAWRDNLRSEEREAVEEILGDKLRELGGIELSDPIGSLGVVADYVGGRIQRAVRPDRVSKAHEELSKLADPIADQVKQLSGVAESVLRQHRKGIAERQFLQKRLADNIADIYAQVAVLSRISSIFDRDGPNASEQERFIAETFCARASSRVRSRFRQMESNDDERMTAIAKIAYKRGEYGYALFED